MSEGYPCENDDNLFEIKKESSYDVNFNNEDEPLSDTIFDAIPFMAKLLSNLRCSFYSEENEIFIANVDLSSLPELFDRLDQARIGVSRMDCGADDSFSLVINCDEVVQGGGHCNEQTADTMRLMPWIAYGLCGQDVSLILSSNDVKVCSLTREHLLAVMRRLHRVHVRPTLIISTNESFFTLCFTPTSLPREWRPLSRIRRPRSTPMHQSDTIVQKNEPQSQIVEPTSLLPSSSFEMPLSMIKSEHPPFRIKGPRGRPRIKPIPIQTFPKRPRGRPRRSDLVPDIISMVNMMPRNIDMEVIRNSFSRFLQSDLMRQN